MEKAGLVKSKRGIQGGYFLSRPPQKITVGEIIKTLEGTIAPVICVEKKHSCSKRKNCSTKDVLQKIHEVLNSTLNSITLADLIKKHEKNIS